MDSRSYATLARRFCKAVHDLMNAPPDNWVAIKEVAAHMDVSNTELVNGALTHALSRGWLKASGQPLSHVLLTPSGLEAALKKSDRSLPRTRHE
jgi:hypothetical protein